MELEKESNKEQNTKSKTNRNADIGKIKPKSTHGTTCCVVDCFNNSSRTPQLSFHCFPRSEALREIWINRIRSKPSRNLTLTTWLPTRSSKVCGNHFNLSGRKNTKELVPRYFSWKTYPDNCYNELNSSKNSIFPFDSSTCKRRRVVSIGDSCGVLHTNIQTSTLSLGSEVELPPKPPLKKDLPLTLPPVTLMMENINNKTSQFFDHCYTEISDDVKIDKRKEEIDKLHAEIAKLHEKISSLEDNLSAKSTALKEAENKIIQMDLLNYISENTRQKPFDIDTISQNESALHFYTGFETKECYDSFCKFAMIDYNEAYECYRKTLRNPKTSQTKKMKISPENQLLMVLSRLRSGIYEEDLAYRFGVSTTTISSLWCFWITHLYSILIQVPIWSSREAVNQSMPDNFKKHCPSVRVILSCIEVFNESPITSKSLNSGKGLLGITPNGWVSFVSDFTRGSASDEEITLSSGILNLLDKSDCVMADRGFLYQELYKCDGTLNTPPLLNGKPCLSLAEEKVKREIAIVRISVDRVVREVKRFRILKCAFPSSKSDKLNPIWKVCCYLVNYLSNPIT